MPFHREKYPDDWEQIVDRVKARAGNRCERCQVPNGAEGRHVPGLGWVPADKLNRPGSPLARIGASWHTFKVVLTTAHLDAVGDVCRCEESTGHKCGNLDHLQSLCQPCHLAYDRPRHARNAAATRRRNSLRRQPELFGEVTA